MSRFSSRSESSAPEPGEPAAHPVFAALARFVLRHRYAVLVLSVLVSGVMLSAMRTRLRMDNRNEVFIPDDSPEALALVDLRESFGSDVVFLVVVEGDVFEMPFLKRLAGLHDAIEELQVDLPAGAEPAAIQGAPAAAQQAGTGPDDFASFGDDEGWGDEQGGSVFEDVISLINVRRTVGGQGALRVEGLLDEWPEPSELPALEQRVLDDPTLVGQVVGEDGRHAVIVARVAYTGEAASTAVYRALRELVAQHRADGFEPLVGGMPAVFTTVSDKVVDDLKLLLAGEHALLLLFLVLIFRHPIGVLGPLLVVGQSNIWMFGSMAISDTPMTMMSGVLGAFLMCVGIGDSVHVQSVYRDARRRGLGNEEAIVHAVASTGVPVLFTTLTTCIGMLSFSFADLQPIRMVGVFGALGVLCALVQSLVLLPVLLTFNRRSLLGAREVLAHRDWLDRLLGACDALSRPRREGSVRRARVTLAAGLLTGLGLCAGITQLLVSHDPISWFEPGTPAVQAVRTIDRHVGGAADVRLIITPTGERDVRDLEVLRGMQHLERHLLDYDDPRRGPGTVGNATSVLDVVRETRQALHGGGRGAYRLPDTQREATDLFTVFSNSGPDELKKLATVDMGRTLMTLRTEWMDAADYAPLAEHLRQGVHEHLAGVATVRPTGAVYNMFATMSTVLRDLITSFSLAFVVITLVMMGLLRELKLGLIAMVPNLLPIACVLGVMGFTDVPLDVNNVLLGSVAIGIAVDDTIHFLHQFRVHYRSRGDVEAAIAHAFSHAGRAMVSTSVLLLAGFAVFLLGEMANTRTFGGLVALSVLLALVADLILCPALLRSFYRDFQVSEPTPSQAPAAGVGLRPEHG